MNWEEFNFLPECIRGNASINITNLDTCLFGSIAYFIELLMFILGVGAFFMLVYGGIKMATAFGEEAKFTEAKKTISHAAIGIIIATLAYTIVSLITSFFGVTNPQVYNRQGVVVPIDNRTGEVSGITIGFGSSSGTTGELTDEEYQAARNGTNGDKVIIRPADKVIVIYNTKPFSANLIARGASSGSVLDSTSATNGGQKYYYVRYTISTNASVYDGGRIVLTSNGESRPVDIEAR